MEDPINPNTHQESELPTAEKLSTAPITPATSQSASPDITATPISPTSPQSKKPNMLIKLGIIFIILSLLSITGYFLYYNQVVKNKLFPQKVTPAQTDVITTPIPETNSTATWKVYSNAQYNYSLKLPTDWIIGAEEKSPVTSKLDPKENISRINFKNDSSSMDVFYEGDFDHGFEPWEVDGKKSFMLGDKEAEMTTLRLAGNTSKWVIVTVASLNNFRIEAYLTPEDSGEFDQILATFQFTNTTFDLTVDNFKKDCVVIQNKGFLEKYNECADSSGNLVIANKLKELCVKYQGTFNENSSTCRHARPDEPCGPEVAVVCSYPSD